MVLWVEGTSGSVNTFTLTVDGRAIGTETTAARGPVTLPWATAASGNGSQEAVTATVRDATGKTGTATLAVTVRN